MLPVSKSLSDEGQYDIYPSFKIDDNLIFSGFDSLADKIKEYKIVTIDGFNGVFFDIFQEQLDKILRQKGLSVSWIKSSGFYKPPSEIRSMTASSLGGDDPLFGKRTSLDLRDFFIQKTYFLI